MFLLQQISIGLNMIYVHEYLSIKQIKYLEEINKGIYLKKGGEREKKKKNI
jgi:hypothetical protein